MSYLRLVSLLCVVTVFCSPTAHALGLVIPVPVPPKVHSSIMRGSVPLIRQSPSAVPISPGHASTATPVTQPEPSKTVTVSPIHEQKSPRTSIRRKRYLPKPKVYARSRHQIPSATSASHKSAKVPSVQTSSELPPVSGSVQLLAPPTLTNVHLESEDVEVFISSNVARTVVVETFRNDSDYVVSGTYLFPLPVDAAFNSFSLSIDGVPVSGNILEASEARREYEMIVRLMVDPGLLEYADRQTIRAKLFPIPAHGTKQIRLEYTQLLNADNDSFRYEFPLESEDSQPIDHLKVHVVAEEAKGIGTLLCPGYKVTTERKDAKHVDVQYEMHKVIPRRNFCLSYSLQVQSMAADLLTHKDRQEDGYFLLAVAPPVMTNETQNKDVVLVADVSGSMQGCKLDELKSALKSIVTHLSDTDHFNIVCFNSSICSLQNEPIAASADNKRAAEVFIDELQARGGTNIAGALNSAMGSFKDTSPRLKYIILVTDGAPTVGDCDVETIIKSVPQSSNVRIFDLGIGHDVNTRLLGLLAERHHGKSTYVSSDGSVQAALLSLYKQISRPVLRDVQVSFEGVQVKNVYPGGTFDVFAGDQQLVLGRYSGSGKANVRLSATSNGQPVSYSFPVTFASSSQKNPELTRLWAMRRIAALEDALRDEDDETVAAEIFSLSKRFGLMSSCASFLVTDPKENRLGSLRSSFTLDGSSLETGLEAIRRAKMLIAYNSSSNVEDTTTGDNNTRTIGSKTFHLQDGVWTDSCFDPALWKNIETVDFGSDRYFGLVHNDPVLAKYFSVGRQLIVVCDGHCYRVVHGRTKPGEQV